jgi:hypothetical protein
MTGKTIFLTTGATFTFKGVTNIEDNEQAISFDYVAMSDGNDKYVEFQKSFVAGHSTYYYDD